MAIELSAPLVLGEPVPRPVRHDLPRLRITAKEQIFPRDQLSIDPGPTQLVDGARRRVPGQ